MIKFDTKEWKEYKFIDIFDIRKGFYNKKPEHNIEGDIPFLGATEYFNGVTEFYSLDDIENASKTGDEKNAPICDKIFPKNAVCVTNNGSAGNAFFQDTEFTCSHDVNPLYLKEGEFNKYTGLFVASVIMQDKYRWGYGRKWRPERMVKSTIRLPARDDGKPDFEYMEKYMKSLWVEKNTSIEYIKLDLNMNLWKEFRIGDIFELKKCKCGCAGDLEEGNETIYIGAKKNNNGVMKKCKIDEKLMSKGNCIIFICDGEGSVGYSNYCDIDFIGSTTLTCGYNKNLNKYVGMFLVTILDLEKLRYSYGRKYSPTLASTIIRLPAREDGEPDFEYMEKFIKNLKYSDLI